MPSTFEGKVHTQEYVWDFAVSGGAISEIELSAISGSSDIPVGAIIKDVTAYVETAMTTGASGTLAWGNGSDKDGFTAATAAGTLLVNTVHGVGEATHALLWDGDNDHAISIYVADATAGAFYVKIETGALSAGKVRFYVEYIMTKTNP